MDSYKIKYLPSFHMNKHIAVSVKVHADGRREAVDAEQFPSVSQTERLYDSQLSAVQAAKNRWGSKGSSARK